MGRMARSYQEAHATIALPAASAPPAPAPPSLAGAPALQPHEIFAFAPYWTLPSASGFNVAGLTTLAYFSVDVNSDGSITHAGSGWVGYQSQALADLITHAHQAGDRVVLTATCFDQSALDRLAADPSAPGRLGPALVQLVGAKNLDGVNLDFEGKGSRDRLGLDRLVTQVSAAVHQANAHWQLTMDTYASSVGDPGGFYDIAGLAPSVDAFFVMAYDMDDPSTPSPNSPLTGQRFSDLDAVQQYAATVSPSKVILGVPYYGYDWPTVGPGQGDPATGPPTPLSYAEIAASGRRVFWDPVTQTPWMSYQVGAQWHQTWFDDPTSLSLKARLAGTYHIAGLGIWAMGMEGNSPAMLAALLGNAPAVKDFQPGPGASSAPMATTTTTTTAASAGPHRYSGTWNGASVTLVAVDPSSLPPLSGPAGQLTGFTTDDPTQSCLASGPPLRVSAVSGSPGEYVVTANPPTDCAPGTWEFGAGGAPSPTSTTSTSTTTTTSSASTTSTTTTTSPNSATTTGR
jgi:hypothetical protein